MEEEKRKSVFQTLTPDECLEGITILTGIGAPMEMKEFIFDRLTLAGAPPSKEFFDEVKKALIVLGAVRAFGFSKSAEELRIPLRTGFCQSDARATHFGASSCDAIRRLFSKRRDFKEELRLQSKMCKTAACFSSADAPLFFRFVS